MKNYISVFILLLSIYLISSTVHKKEIFPIIMCYSDTALTEMVGYDDFGDEYEFLGIDEQCYWKKGFKDEEKFLDTNKVEIPSSTIIWQWKPLK